MDWSCLAWELPSETFYRRKDRGKARNDEEEDVSGY
jgi:hypothetical protein